MEVVRAVHGLSALAHPPFYSRNALLLKEAVKQLRVMCMTSEMAIDVH